MDLAIPYALLFVSYVGLIVFLKGFAYRQILLLMLAGGLLLLVLQYVYISFGREFSINLFFLRWDVMVSDFIGNVNRYLDRFIGLGGFTALFFSLIIPAALEEFWKFYVFKKVANHLGILKSIANCAFAIIYVAIGFASFETAAYVYFLNHQLATGTILTLTLVRIFISTFSHMLFSAVVGYYYGKALFLKFELIDNLEISKTTRILKKLRKIPFIHVHSISRYYTIKYFFTGFFIAILLHAAYNFFMSTGNEIFAVFTVLIGTVLFIKLIMVKKYGKNYLELKNKIAYLQEMKALKEKMKAGINV